MRREYGGRAKEAKYKGGTLFYDAATNKVAVFNQVSFTAEETVTSKLNFEKEAASAGVAVQAYSSDNGIYISKEFTKELFGKGQGIRRSGVGGHHHNGCAENAIKTTVRLARTMMIHAALRWPKMMAGNLWSYELNQEAHLHNHSPDIKSGFTPEELWTRKKSGRY